MKLPQSQTTTTEPLLPSDNVDLNENLDKVISESRNTIAQNEVKAKRGRPPKDPNAVKKVSNSPLKSDINPQYQTMNSDQYKMIFGGLLKGGTDTLAIVFKWDGWKLKPDEIELLAIQTSDVCAEFMPVVESKWFKLGLFGVTAGAIFTPRYFDYSKVHETRMIEIKKKQMEMDLQNGTVQSNG